MKDQALVCNIGHYDNEIQMDRLKHREGREEDQHQAAVRQIHPPERQQPLRARGRPPREPWLRDRSPELRHVELILQPGPRAARLWRNKETYKVSVYGLPKKLDEEVARLHLEKIGVKLTKLSKAQAAYIGVPSEGPYKPDHYRY